MASYAENEEFEGEILDEKLDHFLTFAGWNQLDEKVEQRHIENPYE